MNNVSDIWVEEHAPAKLNLRLKVEGRRSDGFHLLSMLNVSVRFGDEVKIAIAAADGVQIEIHGSDPKALAALNECPSENLAVRAATSYLERCGVSVGLRIELSKNIPLGAGLGGGSADAAAVLRALARTPIPGVTKPLAAHELRDLGLALGADVPYALTGGLAHVEGIGEKIRALEASELEGYPCTLVFPQIAISTPAVYGELRRAEGKFELDSAREALGSGRRVTAATIKSLVDNDLFAPACALVPELRAIAEALRTIPEFVCGMSGSGSSFFCLPREPARSATDQFRATDKIRRALQASRVPARLENTSLRISPLGA